MIVDYEKLDKFEETQAIPKDVMQVLEAVCNHLGVDTPEEEMITYYNRGGYAYAYAKGFSYSYCTFSYANGPDEDYSGALLKFIKGLGFEIVNSYGDNGMDYTTNYRDPYWHYDFAYIPSKVYEEDFIIWEDSDYED